MSRTRRLVVPGRAHHIVLRGNNRRTLFSYPTDYRKFIGFVGRALEPETCRLHALTLMTNHVHCLVTPDGPDDLPQFVKAFAQRYSYYRNRKRGGSGKLFHERYLSKPVLDQSYLVTVQIYIELNAWRAGKVNDPLDHKWSTFPLHAGKPCHSGIPAEIWTPSCWYQGLGHTPKARAARYLELTNDFVQAKASSMPEDKIAATEDFSITSNNRRLERPDRTRAR
jgi:putative transposase